MTEKQTPSPPRPRTTDEMLTFYHGSFLKCYDDRIQRPVWVPLSNVRSIVDMVRGHVWLKEPVPIGANESTSLLFLFHDEEKPGAGLATGSEHG